MKQLSMIAASFIIPRWMGMKLWIVVVAYSRELKGVFSSKEKAEDYCRKIKKRFLQIDEVEIDRKFFGG